MKTFISFADRRFKDVLLRIQKQAQNIHFFDEVEIYTEESLDADFRFKYKKQLTPKVRGFGYWCWKSYIIKKKLENLPEGSHLYYIDAGCHINPNGIKRLQEYDKLLENTPHGILAFYTEHPERQYTKGDVFEYFGIRKCDEIVNSNQIIGGIVLIRKCKESVNLIDEWVDAWQKDFTLIDDSPSQSANFSDFIEHRHDQSLFSCLCKLKGISLISAKEIEPPVGAIRNIEAWQKLKDFPILAMRDRYVTKSYMRKLKKYRLLMSLPLGFISKRYKMKLEKAYNTNPGLMDPPPYLR